MVVLRAVLPIILGALVQGAVVWDGRAPLDYTPLQLDVSADPYLTYVLSVSYIICC